MPTRALVLALLLATAAPGASRAGVIPPNEVGAYLQAGARLREVLVGRRVVTRQALPGRDTGLQVSFDENRPPKPAAVEKLTRSLGEACEAGDTLRISDVRVSRREIAIVFGAGGYREKDADSFAPIEPGIREWIARWRVAPPDEYSGIEVIHADGTVDLYVRPTTSDDYQAAEVERRELQRQRELSEVARLKMRRRDLSRVCGARLRMVSKRDLSLDALQPGDAIQRMTPYLLLVD